MLRSFFKRACKDAKIPSKRLTPPPKIPMHNTTCKTWSWGDGKDGRLGHGDLESKLTPNSIKVLEGCKGNKVVTFIAFITVLITSLPHNHLISYVFYNL